MISRVCVFCGSSPGARPLYADAARSLAAVLVEREIGLVYGGGNVGLMGILADEMLALGGSVIGVIPESLRAQEVAHAGLSDLRIVDSMHARKATMADLADAFLALPGGLGTLEELLEITTWSQLHLHAKPIGVLNLAGYFDPLLAQLDHAVDERFLHPENRRLLIVHTKPHTLVDALQRFQPRDPVRKWMDRDER